MAQNVYTRLLTQLVAMEGSSQAVASLLRVPEGTLIWWMSGRAQMPLRALLKAMDLVAKHELKDAQDKLTFEVGPLRAQCPKCGAGEFRRPTDAPLTYLSLLACCACGHQVVHGDLVVQVAKEATAQPTRNARKVRQHS